MTGTVRFLDDRLRVAAPVRRFLRRSTGDHREHHICDRPRNAPTRTAISTAVITFYGILWLAGGNDIIAHHFHIDLYTTTWIARIAIFAGPVIAYRVTKRICLGLQRKDVALLEQGVETGIIRQLPSGEFTELTRPLAEDLRAVLQARTELQQLAAPNSAPGQPGDADSVPAPAARTSLGRLRLALNESSPKASRCPTPAQTLTSTTKPTSSQRQLLMRRAIPGMSKEARSTQSAKSTAQTLNIAWPPGRLGESHAARRERCLSTRLPLQLRACVTPAT